jgi:hypothetical protein
LCLSKNRLDVTDKCRGVLVGDNKTKGFWTTKGNVNSEVSTQSVNEHCVGHLIAELTNENTHFDVNVAMSEEVARHSFTSLE